MSSSTCIYIIHDYDEFDKVTESLWVIILIEIHNFLNFNRFYLFVNQGFQSVCYIFLSNQGTLGSFSLNMGSCKVFGLWNIRNVSHNLNLNNMFQMIQLRLLIFMKYLERSTFSLHPHVVSGVRTTSTLGLQALTLVTC